MPLNLLQKWEIYHKRKMLKELKEQGIELTLENIPKIILQTSFKIRSKEYPNECPYYKTQSSCHPKIKDLNCFLCACPNYESNRLQGGCKINSKLGKYHHHRNLPKEKVWDCSDCAINHTVKEVEKYLKNHLEELNI